MSMFVKSASAAVLLGAGVLAYSQIPETKTPPAIAVTNTSDPAPENMVQSAADTPVQSDMYTEENDLVIASVQNPFTDDETLMPAQLVTPSDAPYSKIMTIMSVTADEHGFAANSFADKLGTISNIDHVESYAVGMRVYRKVTINFGFLKDNKTTILRINKDVPILITETSSATNKDQWSQGITIGGQPYL